MTSDIKKLLKYSTDPILFTTDILGLQCVNFHQEWLDLFENNSHISLLAPRGHGKTFIVSAYVIWRIVTNPNVRILLVTINQDKANEIMSLIQKHLETNEKLTELYGQQKSHLDWSRSAIRVKGASSSIKEPTLQVLGVTSSMVGGHYDLIILDDVTDQQNSRTEHRRRELVRWFNQTLMPMLEPDGKVISIGTKWHQSDIHSYFESLPNYINKKYVALIKEPTEDEEAEVLWPDRWSYEKLLEIKNSYGNVSFMMQYQNEFISEEEAPIKWEWIENAKEIYKIPAAPFKSYMGVDFASSGEDSDYFAISVITINDGFVSLVDGYRGHLTLSRQFQTINELDQKWTPIRIGVEQAAQQKLIVEDLIEKNPSLPIIPIKSSVVNDRMSRVQRLSLLFETGRISINPRLTHWIDEIASFPRGSHDDTIDSLSFAVQSSQDLLDRRSNVNWNEVPNLISSKETSYGMWKVTKI